MSNQYDIIIIGAGPAGIAAAKMAAEHKAKVLILDEQAAPGGQIYRASEANADRNPDELGDAYHDGLPLVQAFRDSKVDYVSNATVWQLSEDRQVGYSKDGRAEKFNRHLPEHRHRRRPRGTRKHHGRRFLDELAIIHRPEAIADRVQFGHSLPDRRCLNCQEW